MGRGARLIPPSCPLNSLIGISPTLRSCHHEIVSSGNRLNLDEGSLHLLKGPGILLQSHLPSGTGEVSWLEPKCHKSAPYTR